MQKPVLMEYRSETAAESALFSLPAEGVRRMAFDGEFDARRALFLDTETTGLAGGDERAALEKRRRRLMRRLDAQKSAKRTR